MRTVLKNYMLQLHLDLFIGSNIPVLVFLPQQYRFVIIITNRHNKKHVS